MSLKVVKIGGSLFDWPDAKTQLRRWLKTTDDANHVILAGGGPFVDLLRQWDARFELGNDAAHDRAIDLLSITSQLLHNWLPEADWTADAGELSKWDRGPIVFDCSAWARRLDIPKSWDLTSDSLCAILSDQLNASELVLLKSRLPDLSAAADGELVDPRFHSYLKTPARVVNLRSPSFESAILPQPRLVN